MVAVMIGCTRKDENGKSNCNGVMDLEGGEARTKNLVYRCRKCGHVHRQPRGRDAEVSTSWTWWRPIAQ